MDQPTCLCAWKDRCQQLQVGAPISNGTLQPHETLCILVAMASKFLVVAAALLVVTVVGLVLRGAEEGTRASTNVLISGIVPCSTGSTMDMAAVPAFARKDLC